MACITRKALPPVAPRANSAAVNITRILFAMVPAAMLGACATSGDYPSLDQRPAERAEGSFATEAVDVAPLPQAPPSADLVVRLANLEKQATAIHAEFRAATPAAERLASASGATGSDSWAAAQVALADLDSLRSQVAVALADLDALWVDATLESAPRDLIGESRDTVAKMIADEDAVLSRLRSRT
jgi:hypothetical protein